MIRFVTESPVEFSAALTVAAVARRLGVAPATLRTWDRRYGLGPSEHPPGSHRRYSPSDVARLETMRRLTQQGVAPAEAARVAMEIGVDALPVPARAAAPIHPAATAGGGRVVALPGGTASTRGLTRAAMALDARACTDIISEALSRRGVIATWDELVVPVMIAIGERWEKTGEGIEVEHLLSDSAQTALRPVIARLTQPHNPRPVLLASAEEELHSLPLYATAAALAERHVACRVLGSRVPRAALASAVRRSGPCAVFIWSQLEQTGGLPQLAALPAMRPAPDLVLGGPGWTKVPPHARHAGDLTEAVTALAQSAGA